MVFETKKAAENEDCFVKFIAKAASGDTTSARWIWSKALFDLKISHILIIRLDDRVTRRPPADRYVSPDGYRRHPGWFYFWNQII